MRTTSLLTLAVAAAALTTGVQAAPSAGSPALTAINETPALARRSLPANAKKVAAEITKLVATGAAVDTLTTKCREALGWDKREAEALGQEVAKALDECEKAKGKK
ncbi:hypothetical protein IWQ60_010128 [Tieghemiomyces parasiticus]|uniref:Uncharacterized protein n=1 Tax=Tieghemiomyces parasiticus TaxID=78921 RepID=A0A9W7ZMD6_9FUNG|nr:hypothetical protein IWQ60_010128 [Tieghemiomyces parasiticus]